jgi:hypothetical protein
MMKGIAEAVRIHSAFWEPTGTSGPDDPRDSDRPSLLMGATPSNPWHHKLLVDLGTKVRPLRDGGGKPSQGRLTPLHRTLARLFEIGSNIQTFVRNESLVLGHGTQDGDPPLTGDQLKHIRTLMGGSPDEQPAPGQPFYIHLLRHLASKANDPDVDFLQHLVDGVPLGVEEKTLCSPAFKTRNDRT